MVEMNTKFLALLGHVALLATLPKFVTRHHFQSKVAGTLNATTTDIFDRWCTEFYWASLHGQLCKGHISNSKVCSLEQSTVKIIKRVHLLTVISTESTTLCLKKNNPQHL